MMYFRRLKQQLNRFKTDETGSAIVEMLISIPVLIWSFVITLQFFDAYRANLIATKAALTIADMYSREAEVTPAYIGGTQSLLEYLTEVGGSPEFRVTSYYWDGDAEKNYVSWSRGSATVERMTDPVMEMVRDQIPIMAPGEHALLIETWSNYEPKFGDGLGIMSGTGLKPVEFSSFVVISPRFQPKVCFKTSSDLYC